MVLTRKYIFVALAMTSLIALLFIAAPLNAQEKGKCYCIIADEPPKVGTCYDNITNPECGTKETTFAHSCFFVTGQSGKCTEEANQAIMDANGDCVCAISKTDINTSTDQSMKQCAGVKKKTQDQKGKEIDCAWKPKKVTKGSAPTAGTSDTPLSFKPFPAQPPKLNIPLPNLPQFSAIPPPTTKGGSIVVPWLGQYVAAGYQYFVGIASIVAIIILMIGGIQWMTAGGNKGRVDKGKEKITRAIIGLVLALGSYLILYTINPKLVNFEGLTLLTIAREEYADEDVIFDGPATGTGPASASAKATIGSLIAPSTHPKCSKEAAQDVSKRLHDALVCVGPCHCAFTATRFLSFIGCGNYLSGSADRGAALLESKDGWKSVEINDSNIENLPVGYLWRKGHVGVSIGDAKMFESGTGKKFTRVSKKTGNTCPKDFTDALGNNSCNQCAKLKGEEPGSGRFGDSKLPGGIYGARGCTSNQGWTESGKRRIKGFTLIIYPPRQGEPVPALGCCNIDDKTTTRRVSSNLLCKKLAEAKKKKYKWASGVTNTKLPEGVKWQKNTDPNICRGYTSRCQGC